MSLLRDKQIVTRLARDLDLKELTTEASRVILNETELMIRTLLKQTIKYTKKFRRETIVVGDLDIVLDQMNLQLLSMGKYLKRKRLIKGTKKPLLNQFSRDQKTKDFKLHNPQISVKDLMKRIIKKDLKKKKKLQLKFDWLTTHGSVNPNQQKEDGDIICHKNTSFNKKNGTKQYDLNIKIIQKFKQKEGYDKDLSTVHSEKIRDLKYNQLLSRVLERNKIKRNNNRFVMNVEEKEKVEDVVLETLGNGIKSQIVSELNKNGREKNDVSQDLETITKSTLKELLGNINGIDTENFSEEDRRRDFLSRFESKSNNINSLRLLQENLFYIKEVNPSVLTSVRLTRKLQLL
jgi:hypothetical protein